MNQELPLLGIRKRVLFPGALLRLTIGKSKSVRLVESIWDASNRTFKKGAMVAVSTFVPDENDKDNANNSTTPPPPPGDDSAFNDKDSIETIECEPSTVVYSTGTAAKILQLSRVNSNDNQSYQFSMLVEGVSRIRVTGLKRTEPFYVAKLEWIPAPSNDETNDPEAQAISLNIKQTTKDLLELLRKRNSGMQAKTKEVLESIERADPARLADILSANMDASVIEKQSVLADTRLNGRLHKAQELVTRQVEVLRISEKIQSQVEGKLKNTQREYYLRQQQKAINDELNSIQGKSGGGNEMDEVEQLEANLAKTDMPEEARKAADRELQRMKNMQPAQPEYSVIRTYLEWLAELPWNVTTDDNLDISRAQQQLDNDHYGLDKVKRRMVEFLAVRSLKKNSPGPILCLVGPPGVGKTSLGRSIATALNRNFRRIALGGVRDEAEIRGHRRTYIGALPGNIINALKKAGTSNPVILLDEVDKLGQDVRGDPASALLEVLDPEQNDSFTDHYLNVPFDLSKILFICTANDASTIPAPLLDRMEMIEVASYAVHEKVQIALEHLVPKQMERHGIASEHLEFNAESVRFLIEGYTREAGVRNLDREIASVCRAVAVQVAEARDRYVAKYGSSVSQNQGDQNENSPEEDGSPHPQDIVAESVSENEAEDRRKEETDISTALRQARNSEGEHEYNDSPPSEEGEEKHAEDEGESHGQDQGQGQGQQQGPQQGQQQGPQQGQQREQEQEQQEPLKLDNFEKVFLTPELVEKFLGPRRYESEMASRLSVPGVSTGMAWTRVGGEILFVEASISRGSGKFSLTGRMGEVMEESVRAAMSYVRANIELLGLNKHHENYGDIMDGLKSADLHVHIPAGATPKDGPSAGVAIVAAIVSALSGVCVRNDTAVTGEITLRGLVMAVGGIKEKVIAAHRAGIKRVVLPMDNKKNIEEIPESIRNDLEIVFATTIPEALKEIFEEDTKPAYPAWREDLRRARVNSTGSTISSDTDASVSNDRGQPSTHARSTPSSLSSSSTTSISSPSIHSMSDAEDSCRDEDGGNDDDNDDDEGIDLAGPILKSSL